MIEAPGPSDLLQGAQTFFEVLSVDQVDCHHLLGLKSKQQPIAATDLRSPKSWVPLQTAAVMEGPFSTCGNLTQPLDGASGRPLWNALDGVGEGVRVGGQPQLTVPSRLQALVC